MRRLVLVLVVLATVLAGAPGAVADDPAPGRVEPTGTVRQHRALLTWPAVPDATSYEITMRGRPGPWPVVATTTRLRWRSSVLVPGQKYRIVVRAFNQDVPGPDSRVVRLTG